MLYFQTPFGIVVEQWGLNRWFELSPGWIDGSQEEGQGDKAGFIQE
jgi:hypothetical protein